jgi:hypothetical protein
MKPFPNSGGEALPIGGASLSRSKGCKILQLEGDIDHAENKNKSGCRETISQNRNGQIYFFEVTRKSYFNQKNDQTEAFITKIPHRG